MLNVFCRGWLMMLYILILSALHRDGDLRQCRGAVCLFVCVYVSVAVERLEAIMYILCIYSTHTVPRFVSTNANIDACGAW